MPRIHFKKLDLQVVVSECQNEAARPPDKRLSLTDEGYCFELFRRAIENCDEAAWTALYQQYYRLVLVWVGSQQEGAEDLVNQAIAKFWHSCPSKDFARRFRHVGNVLKYLKRCAYSTRLDLNRRQQRQELWGALGESQPQSVPSVEDSVLDDIVRQQRKAQVKARLQDDQERLVVDLSFEQDLPPAQIVSQYPREFTDVEQVRRIKERVVKRLKGDSGIQKWLE